MATDTKAEQVQARTEILRAIQTWDASPDRDIDSASMILSAVREYLTAEIATEASEEKTIPHNVLDSCPGCGGEMHPDASNSHDPCPYHYGVGVERFNHG